MGLKFNVDWEHAVMWTTSAVGGALVAFLGRQDPTTLVQALSSMQTAKPLLAGALVAVLGSMIATAKKSWVEKPASAAPPPMGIDFVPRSAPVAGEVPVVVPPPIPPKEAA